MQTLIKDKPLTSLSIRSNLPLEYSKENRPQSSLNVELQNVFNPVIKGNSIDSVGPGAETQLSRVLMRICAG